MENKELKNHREIKLSAEQARDLIRLFEIAKRSKKYLENIENKRVWFNIDKNTFYIAHKTRFLNEKCFYDAGSVEEFEEVAQRCLDSTLNPQDEKDEIILKS